MYRWNDLEVAAKEVSIHVGREARARMCFARALDYVAASGEEADRLCQELYAVGEAHIRGNWSGEIYTLRMKREVDLTAALGLGD